jgi:hypothetical protein
MHIWYKKLHLKKISKVDDVFWVPIEDGSCVLGQIVEIVKKALNSITCSFFEFRMKEPTKATVMD